MTGCFAHYASLHTAPVFATAKARSLRRTVKLSSLGANCLWDGDDRKKCSRLLDALLAAGAPFHLKESLKKDTCRWIAMLLWKSRKPRPTLHLKILVLRQDFSPAESIVEQMDADEKAEWEDDNNMQAA